MNSSGSSSILSDNDIFSMLRTRGIFPTSQRMVVARVLFAKYQHVTADQLHESLLHAGSRVSKATVYNTLKLFVAKGLLREIFIDSSRTYYDSNTSHHHHYYNMDTGDLGDISEDLSYLPNDADLPTGTSLENVDIVVRVRSQAN